VQVSLKNSPDLGHEHCIPRGSGRRITIVFLNVLAGSIVDWNGFTAPIFG